MKNNTSKTMHYKFFAVFFILGLVSCGGGDSTHTDDQQSAKLNAAAKRAAKSIPVEVKQPIKGLAASFYVTTATLEPSSDAKINSRANGIVRKLFHEEGDDVVQGEILLQLEDDDQKLRVKQAKQKLESSKREYKRLSKMKKAGVVSPTEWEETENAFRTAETEKELAELNLSYTQVAAPFSGRVVWREVDLGEHVGQGDLLFRMMAIDPLLVRVHVPANRIGLVAKGQSVKIILDNIEQPLVGKVHLVSPIVDPNTGTLKVTIQLENYPPNVRPGDFSEVHMVTDQHIDALLVPSTSILEERGQNFVYIAEQKKAKKVEVKVGFAMATQTEIVSGLKQSDLVVTKGQRNLNDGVVLDILVDTSLTDSNQSEILVKEKTNKAARSNP